MSVSATVIRAGLRLVKAVPKCNIHDMEVCKNTEVAEQKYEWGGGGVRGCKAANYPREAWKNFIHMHNSIDRVIVSSA